MKQKMPVKTAPLDLADDGYRGFIAQVRTNLPSGYIRALPDRLSRLPELVENSKNGKGLAEAEAESADIFLKLFPSWDFVDDDGKAIPHTAAGLDAMPDDLIRAMWTRRPEVIQAAVMPSPLEPTSSDGPSEPEPE